MFDWLEFFNLGYTAGNLIVAAAKAVARCFM